MSRRLPANASLEQRKKQAKELLAARKLDDAAALNRFREAHPRPSATASLADAQLVLAREYGSDTWAKLKERVNRAADDPLVAFVEAACVPLDGSSHASGGLGRADALLKEHPDVATSGIYASAVLGDAASVRQYLADDPSLSGAKGGPRGWDALTYLCFSRYLRLDASRSDGFLQAARALLDAGANANTGFVDQEHAPTQPMSRSSTARRASRTTPR